MSADPPRLRLATADDAPAIAEIYAPWVRDSIVSFELEPPSPEVIAGRVEAVGQVYPWLICELGGRVVGYAYATRVRDRPAYDWIAETSIYMANEYSGQGLGARLYTALVDLMGLQGLVWAYAVIALPNPLSQRFHERLGFEHLGCFTAMGYKHGRWCDIDWWRLRLRELPEVPAPLRSIHDEDLAPALAARLAKF